MTYCLNKLPYICGMSKSNKHSYSFSNVYLEPEHQIEKHRQRTWELSFVSIGAGTRTVGDSTEAFDAGEVVLIPPEIPHHWSFDSNSADENGCIGNITLTFDNELLDNCAASFPELGETIMKIKSITDAIKFDSGRAEAISDLLERMNHENEAERIASIVSLLIIIAQSREYHVIGKYRNIERKEAVINSIYTYTMCNYRRIITIADIARHVGMNRTSFCIFFKRETGKSYVNYLNEYRIERVCDYLKRPEYSIAEICYLSGFNDVPYFNRVFKRIKGLSPRDYRHSLPSI